MAKSGFYQTSTLVETTASSLSETATDLSNTDDNAKTSFYRQNTELQAVTAISLLSLLARFAIFIQDKTLASELLARFVITDSISIAANFSGSLASAITAATAQTVFTVKKNGSSVGTITFAAGATVGVFASTSISLVSGDILTVEGPASPDATLANISITIAGTRVT